MGAASISGASRGFFLQTDAEQKSARRDQSVEVKSVVAQAQQVVGTQSAGKASGTGVLTQIGNALKNVSDFLSSTARQVNRELDVWVKKSPILSFAVGMATAAAGLALLVGAGPIGLPLTLVGVVLASKAFDPFLQSVKRYLRNDKPVGPESTPLLKGDAPLINQSSTVKKAD